ncbi:uncharacterized protein LOC109832476 [Asparagus officinalis]|uniref:uncharacterized protein LOC109832476 n=1 Tax=Asparagus officinalis TaxID=4686 RepID=UPI00098DF919|nr:uncharacterized protein LOC109832476 [Asparagus officinalis]
MGTSTVTLSPDIHVIQVGSCLSESQANFLSRPVSKEEIKNAIFSMDDNKAPGPDGYRNYTRKNISPRIMMNIDIRKAFDTNNWDFLKEMLQGLGFPTVMIKWIMACISSPKYSISLSDFSEITGLEANMDKCSVYYGRVNDSVKVAIHSFLGFTEGTIPFRYLGVPLNYKRLTSEDCNPLIEKISSQFQKWLKHNNLSYAGRIQGTRGVGNNLSKSGIKLWLFWEE